MSHTEAPARSLQEAWVTRVVASLGGVQTSPLGEPLPAFPDATLQANTTGLSGEAAIRQAGAFHEDVASALAAAGACLQPDSQILDFGCGWGRIGRMFLRDTSARNIHGIDVDPEFVALCRTLFASDNFSVCEPFPPSKLGTAQYDLVIAYSVFSHLSEDAVRGWLKEFHRLLKPGGFVAFTTRHHSFFDYLDWAKTADGADPYTRALGQLFANTETAKATLKRGDLVHATSRGVSGGGVRDETFYGETWIPEAWLEREFGDYFERVATCFDGRRYDQVAYVLRRHPQA